MTDHDVASLEELDPAGLREVDVAGEKILLLRDGETVFAVGGRCPHAGAPLAQGVRHGTRIICPWHKASFCGRTGKMLEPPALDDLPRYPTRVRGGRIIVTLPAVRNVQMQGRTANGDTRHFVIIGAGAAGAVAAQTLRREGFGGRITMLDRVNRVPYDRTILSKYALSGEKGAEKSPLQSQAFYQEHGVHRRAAEATSVDAASRRIMCADGESLTYDAALIATGSAPSRPDLPGATLSNVFVLRSIADANAILVQAERSRRAVVLGASFIGMEVAASLRERGLEVVVVSQEQAPFEKQLGAQVGGAFVSLHKSRGVSFRLGAGIRALEGRNAVHEVVLEDGERLPADLVVIGFGVKPVTDFVHGVAFNDDGGIKVDTYLAAAPGLYAAGDIACFPTRDGPGALRVEHWRVAEQHGQVAALNMIGKATQYRSVPVFWTIQYMKRLDYIGHALDWDDMVVHGDLEKPEFLAYYVKEGRVVAAAGMDRDQDTAALIALFEHQEKWTAEALGESPAGVLARLDASTPKPSEITTSGRL
jgi:NADPH-dependent 2,4-dienoyl-CoA reductase/sulfur reductase-like enzyme/nitrite reductase/ring-hydroxylating ferredoxin subunit